MNIGVGAAGGLAHAASAAIASAMASAQIAQMQQRATPTTAASASAATSTTSASATPTTTAASSSATTTSSSSTGTESTADGTAFMDSEIRRLLQAHGVDANIMPPAGAANAPGNHIGRPMRISRINIDNPRFPMMMGHGGQTAITLHIGGPGGAPGAVPSMRLRRASRERSADARPSQTPPAAATSATTAARSRSADSRRSNDITNGGANGAPSAAAAASGNNNNNGSGGEHPRCSVMAELLRHYRDTQRRLDPHLSRYINIMDIDPVYEDSSPAATSDADQPSTSTANGAAASSSASTSTRVRIYDLLQ